jgi:hypothetical protein
MRRLAIQNLLKCMGRLQIFIDPHWYFILHTGFFLIKVKHEKYFNMVSAKAIKACSVSFKGLIIMY